jgi:hypothetical protein
MLPVYVQVSGRAVSTATTTEAMASREKRPTTSGQSASTADRRRESHQ